METNNYPCAQSEFYQCGETGWASFDRYQTDFEQYSPKYTVQYGKDAKAEVAAAKAMPDVGARNSVYRALLVDVTEAAWECTNIWQSLKAYITATFEAKKHHIYWDAAGQSHFAAASGKKWSSVNSLMTNGLNFINEHQADFNAKNTMPKDFAARFKALMEKFGATYSAFLAAEVNAEQLTAAKLSANNDCYAKLIAMFTDGARIFRKQEAIRKEFVFGQVLQKIAGSGTSGFAGEVLEAASGQPIEAVEISIAGRKETVVTDVYGRFEFRQIAAGKIELVLVKKGYMKGNWKIETKPNTINRLGTYEMQAEVMMPVLSETVATDEKNMTPLVIEMPMRMETVGA